FFQAEDGIRDFHVTGVQTCALPISRQFIVPLSHTNVASREPEQCVPHSDQADGLSTRIAYRIPAPLACNTCRHRATQNYSVVATVMPRAFKEERARLQARQPEPGVRRPCAPAPLDPETDCSSLAALHAALPHLQHITFRSSRTMSSMRF